jgi:hypothetical protein
MNSTPMHHNDVVLVGTVELVHTTHSQIVAILLTVASGGGGDALKIIIVPRAPPPAVQRGDVLWCRGRLACDPAPQRKALHFIDAAHIEVVKRRHEHGQSQARSPGEGVAAQGTA